TEHGTDMALALIILIVGLLVARLIDRGLRKGLRNLWPTAKFVTTLCNVFYIVLVALVVSAAAVEYGAKPVNILRLLTILSLIAVGLILFFRPFMPTMPFKVGETVKAGNLLGKVEAMTFLNTRLRTFDGKTFFVPNQQILNDVVINYQFSGSRRIKVDLTIRYDEDLLKAKRAMEAVMTEDARVKTRPGPMVYVLKLAGNGVELGGRCWVHNKDYWVTRCDLTEKIKLRFDREGLRFALPQLDLHLGPDPSRTDAPDRPIDGVAGIDATDRTMTNTI
ncbi:MAG: mechanosensitive ion channel family protein, partial [Desulfosarcina sp.]